MGFYILWNLPLHSLMTQTDCREEAQELEQQSWKRICCRGGDFGTSEAQEPFKLARILCWRPGTLDSLWLYAKPEHTLSTSWTARSRVQSQLGKKNEDRRRFCRRDRVSHTTSLFMFILTASFMLTKLHQSYYYLKFFHLVVICITMRRRISFIEMSRRAMFFWIRISKLGLLTLGLPS